MPGTCEVIVRKATEKDCHEIRRFMQELADYSGLSDAPKVTVQDLIDDGGYSASSSSNNQQPALYQCQVAEKVGGGGGGQLCGYVLYFWTYSWEGRSVYMEDLYVTADCRGRGIGKLLWKACVQAALDKGCIRCDFSVLRRNESSIEFYKHVGGADMTQDENYLSLTLKKQGMSKLINRSNDSVQHK